MALPASPDPSHRTALLVMRSKGEMTLSPFFGKCDGVLVIDPHKKTQEFHVNQPRTADSVCALILKSGAPRLVCGFVAGPEKQKLRAAGVDVRLGSPAGALEDLAAHFDDLPQA
jgi:predicted Fe-Mo cluster-binding NifX family protein